MVGALEADYLVVGAGAAGMAFVDTLVDHDPKAHVLLVDRRPATGGHWLDAYPFVRLHQSSQFYGVASTRLGGGRVQTEGPETGLHERATGAEVRAYYAGVLERLLATGRVEFLPRTEHLHDGVVRSLGTGRTQQVRVRRRVVDAQALSGEIPATTPAPFAADDDVRVIPVGLLPALEDPPARWVVVGSGKTATDACLWLLDHGADPDAVCWVRPREPWMFSRAVIQPDPAVFLGMVADLMESAPGAASPDVLFERLEERGVMLRIDPAARPTMAKTPTLARWELDRLRTLTDVVRLGHLRRAQEGRLLLDGGEVATAKGAVVVHCAASGLGYPPLVPLWGRTITLLPIRSTFPCFNAALAGFVEATRDDDTEKNALCPPSPYPDTPTSWIRTQVIGGRNARSFGADPEIRAWAGRTLLNPMRIGPEDAGRPEVQASVERVKRSAGPGMASLEQLAGMAA